MLDIDYFKKVNDSYGHDVGDLVIKSIARRLLDNAGNRDIVARIGGEEFCVLTPGCTKQEIIVRFEDLRRQIETTPAAVLEDKEPIFVTSSIGICAEICEGLEAMMKKADEQLYRAKNSGRNRVLVAGPVR